MTLIPEPILVFDTDCVLCSILVKFILMHERGPELHFVGAWSTEGLSLARRYGFSKADLNETFLLVQGGTVFVKSDAGLQIVQYLRRPWRWLAVLRVIPKRMRDFAYSFIAKRRYKLFGHTRDCARIPTGAHGRFFGVAHDPSTDV
jgi:predicted DCC family thiol-disulfide oxidoreductase YuxK